MLKGWMKMSDVKWIKLMVNTFTDEKIRYIRTLPNGAEMVLMWLWLLCLCGKSNSGGYVMMTDTLPYNPDILASTFDVDIKLVQFALSTFQNLRMIEIENDSIYITNWEKYQSLGKLEAKKKYDREYQRKKREQKKLENKVKMIVSDENRIKSYDYRTTVVNDFYDNRSIDIDIEEDIEIDKDISNYNNKENPSISEVERFIKDNGLQLDANDTYHYFSTTGWKNWQDITIQWDLEVKQYLKKGS